MRRQVGLCTFMLVLASASVPTLAIDLGPGGFWFSGSLTELDSYRMQLDARQTAAGDPKLLMIKVYSEPSHSLLMAMIDESAPIRLLLDTHAEAPRTLSTGIIGQSSQMAETASPPAEDQRIRVEYAIATSEGIVSIEVAEAYFEDLQDVAISSEPIGGNPLQGGYRHCGWCYYGGQAQLCGCVECSGDAFTVCCNTQPCRIYCGIVVCPH